MDRKSSTRSVTSIDFTESNNSTDDLNWNLLPDSLRTETYFALLGGSTAAIVDGDDDNNMLSTEDEMSSSTKRHPIPPPPRVDLVPQPEPTTTTTTVTTNTRRRQRTSNHKEDEQDHPRSSALSNGDYGETWYWDERFAIEDEYEWLVSYVDVASRLEPYLQTMTDRILVVGCGNSKFSYDLYQAGFTNVCNIDFSWVVIDAMKQKYQELCPTMDWQVMDMTDLSAFPDKSFDVVIDKAAMDALMVQEGDVWHPDQRVIDQARSMCHHISRILKPNGRFLQISFAQPHFRRKYLLGLHPTTTPSVPSTTTSTTSTTTSACYQVSGNVPTSQDDHVSLEFQWRLQIESIAEKGCFENFFYILNKL